MMKKTRYTARLELTNPEDLEEYDRIMNDPDCRIIEKTLEHQTITEFSGGGEDGGGTTTSTKIPFWIVTYEVQELL